MAPVLNRVLDESDFEDLVLYLVREKLSPADFETLHESIVNQIPNSELRLKLKSARGVHLAQGERGQSLQEADGFFQLFSSFRLFILRAKHSWSSRISRQARTLPSLKKTFQRG